MSDELIHVFTECLVAIEEGRLTVDECLQKYPQHQAELIDFLQIALQARAVPPAMPTAAFRHGARARLLAQLSPHVTASDGVGAAGTVAGITAINQAAVPPTFSQRLQTAWQSLMQRWPVAARPSLVGGAVLLVVAILFVAFWLRGSGKETDLAQYQPPPNLETLAPTEVPAVAVPDPTTTAVTAAAEPETTAVAAAPDQSFTTFVPILSVPLELNAQTAAVKVVRGFVEVQGADGTWTAVNRITTAAAGQRVRTGPFSSATLTFFDGSQATLRPQSEISLDEVNALRPADGFRTVVMTQWLGESEHQVAFRNDGGSRYEVKTPNGSGVARGTVFRVLVTVDLLTYFIVDEGRVDVSNVNVTVIVIAGQITVVPPQQPPSQPHFIVSGQGEVTAIGETWTIGGQIFTTTDYTIIVGNPRIGDIVSVYGYLLPDGTLVATHIILQQPAPADRFTLTGEVESIGADAWVVAGQTIVVNDETAIDPTLVVGDVARVYGRILDGGVLLAERIDRLDDVYPFEFVGVVQSITPDLWVISGVNIAVDEPTEIRDEIVVGDVVKVEGMILPTGTWLADEIKLAEDNAWFEFTGPVHSLEPWIVAGIPFETDAFTEIDDGIDVGDLVYVEGPILADGTWLAREIRLLSDDGLTFTFIGTVNSIDPWLVSGIPLAVDENTLIGDDVVVGALVRVYGRILPDGTWLATVIVRLDPDDDPIGCYTLTAMVIGVSGNQITLQGLPPITLNESISVEGDITPNTIIIITICISPNGTILIISIIVIHYVPPPPPPQPTTPPPPPGGPPPGGGGSYDITENSQNVALTCNGHTVTVRGNANTVTLTGHCASIVVRGNANTIFYQSAGSISNTGNGNTIQQR